MKDSYLSSILSGFALILLGYFIHDIKNELRNVNSRIDHLSDILIGKIIDHSERISKLEK